jgi:hypothetical protein
MLFIAVHGLADRLAALAGLLGRPCEAMPSVTLAFSVFWLIEAAHLLDRGAGLLDARGLLAGALAERLRRRADLLRGADRPSAALRTSVMICPSFSTMLPPRATA